MKILVYAKDWYPLETGFSFAFQGLCETLATVPGVEVAVATSIPLGNGPEKQIPGVSVTRLPLRYAEQQGTAIVGGVEVAHGKLFKLRRMLARMANRVHWGRLLARQLEAGGYDLLLFESGDDPIVMAAQPTHVLRRSAVRFHSTGDTEIARWGHYASERIARLLIRRRIAPNLRVLFATNRAHLNFIKSFYYQDDALALAGRYLATIDNVVADFVPAGTDFTAPREGPIRIVTLGRMDDAGVAQKGFEDLLYALATLSPEERAQAAVTIIGDGPDRTKLERVRDGLGLAEVRFTGRMSNDQVRQTLIEGDVIALLSRFEGRSVFAIEGMLAACAVFFTDTGGLADLIEGNGWSVPVQDIGAIAETLRTILATPRDEIAAMGRSARAEALRRFSAAQIAQEASTQLGNAVRFLATR